MAQNLTEQETRSRHITPALRDAGWPTNRIWENYTFTDSRIITRRALKIQEIDGQEQIIFESDIG